MLLKKLSTLQVCLRRVNLRSKHDTRQIIMIDRVHKWRPINYSFLFLLINETNSLSSEATFHLCSVYENEATIVGFYEYVDKAIIYWPLFMNTECLEIILHVVAYSLKNSEHLK